MTENGEKLCPFDKNSCIGARCVVWAPEYQSCAFSLVPLMLSRPVSGPVPVKLKEKPSSSGLSGKYRDPLFD